MSALDRFKSWQLDNIERKCNEAVREALFYGMGADELRNMLANSWASVCHEQAERGREAITQVRS